MGGLSSGPGPGLCLLTLVVLIVAQQAQTAPVQEDSLSPQSRAQGYYDGSSSELSTGCYYNFQHYGEGDRIITNEPCLNCTCHNRMLMCYLRVCPFTKAIGQNCTIEKKPGQCCPLIICPEVPVQLLTSSTTTEHSESMPHRNQIGYGQYGTAVGHLDDYGCKINGEFYTNGAQIPGNIDKPCEVCYCIRNRTACIMQECTLQVEGCIPVYEEGLCCPVRYQCDYEYNYNAITTEQPRPTPGLVLTTTTSGPFECQHDNKWYADGAMVETEDSCEHCYCMKGDIVCAVQECKPPFEKDGHNCTAMPPAPGKCCPDSYHCDGNEIVDESEPTFRQDRMHKFGQNNANITMSITSSTSNGDKQHGWHYGASSNENEMPNRFTDEHDKDGTTKPGKPASDSDMMVTEGVPPTSGPLESGSHHVDGHGGGSGMGPMGSHSGTRPMEGQTSTSQGHGVNTDNMLTISQVIQSIVQNQTNLFNQNKLNQTGKPDKRPPQLDDKIVFPIDGNLEKKPGMDFQTDEDGNPIEAHPGTTDFPNEYYGFTGSSPNIYAEHGGQPQKKPSIHKKPGTAGAQDSVAHPVSGENQGIGGHKRPGMTQHAQKKPVVHQQPGMAGTLVITDDEGNPIEIYEGATNEPETVSGRPGSSGVHSGYGEQGRPQRPGMQESVTGVYGGVEEGFTGRPDGDGTYSSFDEYGKPQKRPVIHKKPGGVGEGANVMGSHDLTGKPVTSNQPEIFGEHGHVGRPHKKPGTTDDEMVTETYEEITDDSIITGKPVTDEHGRPLSRPGSQVITHGDGGFHGKPQKRPGVHKQPGDQMTGEDSTEGYETGTETVQDLTGLHEIQTLDGESSFTGRPNTHEKPGLSETSVHNDGHGKPVPESHGDGGEYIYYDKYGKPHKRPAVHTRPGTESEDGEVYFEGTTELNEGVTQEISSQKPQTHIKPTMTADSHLTDEDGNPIDEITGSPETDEFEIFYDKYGRPHKRPVTHKKPGSGVLTHEHGVPVEGVEGDTDFPESYTKKPVTDYQIYYDQHGRPHKRPVTHKKPESEVMTDEHGKPVDGVEGVTGLPEGLTGKPGTEDQQIFYDEQGRPHKRPVTHKKPGSEVMTDGHGEPVEAVEGVTDLPEGFTSKPGTDYQIFYDQHGRPHKRPVTHKKPGSVVLTDEHGVPVEGDDGVTEYPEGITGKPGTDYEIFYDQHGRPHKRPVTHKKPDSDDAIVTDEYGVPVKGVTDHPQGSAMKPVTDYEIFYDEKGRPHKRPVTHKKPGSEVMTDEHGEPVEAVEGVTDIPEGFTGKPGTDYQIFYDQYGRPHKRPVTHKKPDSNDEVLTDEHDIHTVTEFPEGFTRQPETDYQIFYDKDGRPHKRPIVQKKPQSEVITDEQYKPVDGVEDVTDHPEASATKPGTHYEIFYDEQGRPHKRPVTHKKPGSEVMTDEHGVPVEGDDGVTEYPEGITGKPGTDYEIFYDQNGRPHKRPVTHKKPGAGVLTDEHGVPLEGVEGVTDLPDGFTGKPGTDYEIFYDQHGRPHKRPVTHKKPESEVVTDEHGAPVEGVEGVTEYPEGITGKPGTAYEIFYDQHGRPHKRPVTHKKPESGVLTDEHGKPVDGVEGVTDLPEGSATKPGPDYEIFYDEQGRPHKRPVVHKKPDSDDEVLTDEHGVPVEGVTDLPEGFTGKPGTEDQQIYYDEHGTPHKRPVTHEKPGSGVLPDEHGVPVEGDGGVTEYPEGLTDKPGTDEQQIFYDEHGRPHKRPVTHKKPGSEVMTDEHGVPVEGVTDLPEGFTGKPGTDYEIFYDQHGRPHKRPVTHKKPGSGVLTDEHGVPVEGVEGVTEYPEGFTGKPGTDNDEIFYDKFGRPHKRPVTDKVPGLDEAEVLGDKHKKPIDAVTKSPEGHGEEPEHDDATEIMFGYGQTGKPDTKPSQNIPGLEGVHVLTDEVGSYNDDYEGITGMSGNKTGKPSTQDETAIYGEPGSTEHPHKRPVTLGKPGEDIMTDEKGQSLGGMTEIPEEHTDRTSVTGTEEVLLDQYGRPHKRPISHEKPGENFDIMTEIPEGFTGRPESDSQLLFYDQFGRPHKRPVSHKKPGEGMVTDEHEVPVEGVEDVTGKPVTDDEEILYDEHGRPHKRPVIKKPGSEIMTDEQGIPAEGVEGVTDLPDGFTGKPGTDYEIFYDQHGRPHKRPVTHKKPESEVMTDEHGKPVDGIEGVTGLPEGLTGKPGTEDEQIYYDEQGRPHKRPVTSKKPGSEVMTDEHGKPVEAVEGVTDLPEGFTGKPGTEDQQIFYDEEGRPHKRPVSHKKPGSEVMTDEHGAPVEGVTDLPEGFTGKPGTDYEIFYDQHGRPHKRPVVHKKPDSDDEVMTDEHGVPVEGVTDLPEGFTGKPGTDYEIFYDQHGRPHKRPVTHKKPESGVLTDEHGKPVDGVEGVTGLPEGLTGKPGTDYEIFYDQNGRPHKRPVTHEKPGSGVLIDEHGVPVEGVEGVTDLPDGFTGKPGTDYEIVYDQHGKPHKRPVTHKKPESGVLTDEHGKPVDGVEGVTDLPEGFTGEPGTDYQIFFDEQGRPHKRPVTHVKPGFGGLTDEHGVPVVGVTDFPEGVTGKPGTEYEIFYDEDGRPHKRPVIYKKPEENLLTDKEGEPVDKVTESPESDTADVLPDSYDQPVKRPVTPAKPQVTGTDEDHYGMTESFEGVTNLPESVSEGVFYDNLGRPHKKPAMDDTYEHGVPQAVPDEGQTPDGADHGHVDRPHSRPSVNKEPSMDVGESLPEEGESFTKHPSEEVHGEPGVEPNFFGETGRPQKKPIFDKQPSVTDEKESPIVGVTEAPEVQTSKPESDEMDMFIDKYGKPHKRPVSHVKPDLEVTHVLTDETDQEPIEKDTTESPEEQAAMLEKDKTGQSGQKDKKPEGQLKPDSDGTDETEQSPEDQKEKPGYDTAVAGHDQDSLPEKQPGSYSQPDTEETADKEPDHGERPQIYGEHGSADKPQKIPDTLKKPGMSMEEDGSLVGVTTELPETQTAEIAYDKYGRPHKRPVTDKKPEIIATGEHSRPDDRPEGTTYTPEDLSVKPETDEQQIYHDPYGRPQKKPATHEKPGETMTTNEHDLPVKGVEVTESLQTEKPEDINQEVLYDEHGRPYKRPVAEKKPGDGEIGKPVAEGDTTTEYSEGFTGKPLNEVQEVYYDENGRPYKKPEVEKQPDLTQDTVQGEKVAPGTGATEKDRPTEGHNEVTEAPEDYTGKPGTDEQQIFYDEHGRPHKRPVTHKKPGSEVMTDEHGVPVEGVTDLPEGFTGKPGTDYEIFYDQHGRPHKRPVTHKKPGSEVMTDEHGVPVEGDDGVTEYPEGITGKPGTDYEIFYDQNGRPHKRPVTHKKPGAGVLTDEHGVPVEGVEDVTDLPDGFTGKPGTDYEIFYDQHGRPHKRPVTHKKPESEVVTDEHGAPVEGVTDLPEGFTGKPGTEDQQIYYDEQGRPHKRPVTHKKPGSEVMTDEHGKPVEAVEGVTDLPEGFTVKPGTEDQEIFYDEEGRPHKRPVTHKKPGSEVMTDEHGAPVEDVTDLPEGFTGKPGTEDQQIYYDEQGRPHKRPVTHKKPGSEVMTDEHGVPVEGDGGVTEYPEGITGKPGTDEEQIYYDEHGRPHKRPVTHKKPGSEVMTDEHGVPVEGVTDLPEGFTGKPGTDYEIFYDQHGRPHKRPVTHKKPGSGVLTDEHGVPVEGVEGVTEYPEGFTGKPGTDNNEIFYDKYGRPHKRPVTDKIPGLDEAEVLGDKHKKPTDAVTKSPEGHGEEPEHDDATEIMFGYGQTGKPDITPSHFIPGPEGVSITEEDESVTKSPESFTGKPESSTGQSTETHEHGKPLGSETKPLGHEQERPQEEEDTHPVYDDQKPSYHGQPVVSEDVGTATADDSTETADSGNGEQPMIFGEQGHSERPSKRPVKPTSSGTSEPENVSETSEGKPEAPPSSHEQDMPVDGTTSHKKPDASDEHVAIDMKKPELGSDETATTAPEKATVPEDEQILHQKPDMEDSQSAVDVTETSDKGDESTEIYYDNLGRPHKRPVHTKPAETDEMPETGLTGVPTTSSEHGVDDDHHRPSTTGVMDEVHTTEGAFHHKPDEIAKPGSADEDEKKPDFDESEKPHKKPVLKPGSDFTGIMVDETGEQEIGTGVTEKPEDEKPGVHDEETGFKPGKRPATQEADEGTESATKLPLGTVHDTKVPGIFDGQKPVDHEPEENEIFGVPEKDVTGADRVTTLPEVEVDTLGEHSRPQKKPSVTDHESEDGHTTSPDLVHHYPQQLVPSKTPGGDHPSVGDDTTTEEDDESLIITTDETEEETTEMPQVLQEVHKQPESEAEEKPLDTKTKIPSQVVPGQAQQGSTPGLSPQSDDFTTPLYGAHDESGVPVTEKDGTDHMTAGKPGELVPGTSTAFDEESKPVDTTTPKGTFEGAFPTTGHPVEDKDHQKPAAEDKKPALTESTSMSEEDDDESRVPEKDSTQGTPAGVSDTVVSHGDTRPDLSPSQNTDGVTDIDSSLLPEGITPVSTPEGTQGVPESASSVPSGEMHSVVSSTTETPGKVSETKPASYQPPHVFIPYLPPFDGSSTKHPILIDEGLHESSAPFDDVLNNLANILRPSQTTEEPEGTTEDHAEVPGEGSCFMDGVTYQHNEDIPPLSPCHTKCTCISSIIHCLSLKCPPPPEDVSHCTVVHEKDRCCPIYVCGTDVSPTLPVENHEGETTTVSSDKDESATVHGYEPIKPQGVTSQKPEVTGSEDSSHTDQDMPIKYETDHKTSQESKPGMVSETKKPQFGGEVPEESDKGTPLTEKPEEDSVDEAHTSQEMDHVMSSKPESSGTEPSTESKTPTKTEEDGVTPETSHITPGEPQSGYRPISVGSKHPSTGLPIYFGTEKPEYPYQSHHKPESVDHVLDTDKPDQDKSTSEGVKPHEDKEKPEEMDGSKPDDFVEPTTYRPVYHGTTKPTNVIEGLSQDNKTPDKVAAGEGEPLKPEESEKETEPSEPHEHDETETDIHSTLEEQKPAEKPVEKPDEITSSKGKPQSGQESVVTEELGHQTTERPGEKEPQIHLGTTSHGEEIVHGTSRPHEQPETGVKPTYSDETPAHTTVVPHGESPETEESDKKPVSQSTDEPESNIVQSSSQKPGLHQEPTIPDLSVESDPSIKRPITHDKPSEEEEEEEEEHEQTSALDTDRPTEVLQTQKPGQPISEVSGADTVPTEGDLVSTDKTHAGAPRPTNDTVAESEESSKKPEEFIDEHDESLAHSTAQPFDQSESGKPLVSSGEATDTHKKPQLGQDAGEGAVVTSEEPYKGSTTEMHASPVSEDSANVTVGPHEEAPEEYGNVHDKRPSVHPTAMDNESAFTTEEPSAEDKEPQEKPGTETYPTLTDDKSSETKPGEEPTDVEQPHTKPESEEGFVVRPTEEGSVVKKPTASEKPVFGEKVPIGEQETDLVHSTTESQTTGGKPEETKPQHTQDFSSTIRPKPTGIHGVSGQGKPQTDDIPEEVLLHPTRMPGTYETARPDYVPDVEEDDVPSQRPQTEIENVATIFPEGIIRPITKRPIYGTGKPAVSDNKESTTSGHPFIQFGPQTGEGTVKPEDLFEGTAKPIFDVMTNIPEDFAELFGIKPPTVHGQQPDKHDKPQHTTHFFIPDLTTRVPDFKPQTVDHVKRPIHSTNGTHFIQYVPYKEDETPLVPEGATLGELVERPDGEKYWPVIYMKLATTTPGTEVPQRPFKPIPQQVFNGTHFIQYVPNDDNKEPEVPEGATLGQPQKGPDGQIYWPIIGKKPIMSPEDRPATEQPYPGQVYNGTHFIQYVPFKEGQKPEIPENATLGEPENAPNGQKFWPIISNMPIPEDDSVTSQRPIESQPEQIFNGTHFIQFAPYNDGDEPEIPEEATLGQPQKGPDGQIYWPIIDTKPLPAIPDKPEPVTEQPSHSVQVFNGTNFIQYVPFKDGVTPEVPEGATLGQPQKGPDDQIYWPIIYTRPRPVKPQGPFPEQVYNGTNFIQYVPYKDGQKPEVPSDATLGQPQKAPDGQMYWPIIYMKPVTAKPEEESTTGRPSQAPVFNGTHFIQYIPYMEGFEPDIPEEATLGQPERRPDGEMYWPIIYQKLPTRPKPEAVPHYPGQFFNGTHFVQYVPYRPSHKPHVPEGVTVSQPQKGPDGQMYWMIVSNKPLPTVLEKPTGPQFFNGTHFIQYVPYEMEKEPEIPEGATLGKPETGTGGQKFWPIIYMKPLPDVPITHQKPFDEEQGTPFDPYKGQVFNGTHYVQYVPYVPGKIPHVPETGVLGQPTKRPDGQMYWPIIFLRPVPGVPVAYEDQIQTFDPIKGPIFNGTHYVQYVPYKPGERPILPEGATLGQPTRRPNGQLYWPIYSQRPVQESPIQGPASYDYISPQPEQVYNGTHFIQYLPYNPTRMPEVPEGATLGQPVKRPGGQMYWVIISENPIPAQTFNDTHVVQYVTPVTPEQDKPQTDQNKPIQVFNGSHYIQYVPYTPGQKPVVPEGASLGQPTKGPEGQMYWPIIYMKPQPGKPSQQVPMFWGPAHDYLDPVGEQIFNGTHFIRFIKYDPRIKPMVPEGATISDPQRRPDGQLYWVIASKKPFSDMQVSLQQQPSQIFNGTHYIQYVPYNASQMPQVPEGAVLGHPQKGPEGQMYWVIISDKPLPAQPGTQYVQYVTPVTPEDDQMVPGPMFNGTHYIQYVPYQHAQVPKVPQDAVLGELHRGPGGQMYWPIIYRRPPPQSFNGTHYIQYVPDNATGAGVSKPGTGAPHLQPANATSKPAEDHPFWSYGQYAPRPGNGTLPTLNKYPSQKPGTEEHAFWTYGHDKPQNGSQDNYNYKPTTEYPSWSSGPTRNATKVPEISKLPSGQYGGGDHSKPGYEYESGYYKPEKPERPSASEDSYETIDEDHLVEYPSGSDYDETQEQPYGPGTCRYAGKVYVSAQQIPRDDPCDFCFCFRSDIICLQQSCPPPIPGCHEEPIQGFCCPRYECHVRMATLLNVTSTTTTTTTTLPPHFLSHVYKGAAGRTGCFIQGKAYRVGQAIPSASGPCMDCMCGGDGKMKCEPKVCTPEPMVRQMMVSSEKPTTANHR